MKEKKKRIIGLFLALVMFIGCLSLNPTVTYAEGDVAINETNFPDSNFRDYVKKEFDTDKNEVLSQDECNNVKKISVPFYWISSLKGIEFFKNLEFLECVGNSLTELNLSKNTALSELDCSNNKLRNLDLSQNAALTILYCEGIELQELDLSKNAALSKLYCSNNKLRNLDLSQNAALTILYCGSNELQELDLSRHTALKELDCYGNKLTGLDVSGDTALTTLKCPGNQLTSLDVSQNAALTILKCQLNQLTSLDVSGHTALKTLQCEENKLTSLDVSGDIALENLYCNENQLTSLDVSGHTALKILQCEENKLTSLDVSGDIALTELYCYENKLTSLDVSGDIALTELKCQDNHLTSLDVSGHKSLTRLFCDNNQLTSLDVKGNTALTNLGCDSNKLTNLDLRGNTAISALGCRNNNLTKLDISQNTTLGWLGGDHNPLTSVKLPERNIWKHFSPVTYIVETTEGSSKIPFTALPQGFDSSRIQPGTLTGVKLEKDGFTWNKSTNPIKFKYKLWDKPGTNDAELREAYDDESGFVDAELSVKILEVVGPVDPNKTPNPNPDKYWTVKFESEDPSKGTVTAENTFYVLKTAGKTLADLKDKAPATASKADYEFDKWDPALDKSTAIDKDITVKAYFKQVDTKFIPLRINLGKANVIKTIKLKVELVIGSNEMIESIDGVEKIIIMDVSPFIEKGRTMLPIRFVAEGLGFSVQWDKENRTAILIDKENVVKIPVDTNKIIVNGKEYISDVKPVIKNDRTMLSIGNIARALGLKDDKDIHWNENTKEVIITREIAK